METIERNKQGRREHRLNYRTTCSHSSAIRTEHKELWRSLQGTGRFEVNKKKTRVKMHLNNGSGDTSPCKTSYRISPQLLTVEVHAVQHERFLWALTRSKKIVYISRSISKILISENFLIMTFPIIAIMLNERNKTRCSPLFYFPLSSDSSSYTFSL